MISHHPSKYSQRHWLHKQHSSRTNVFIDKNIDKIRDNELNELTDKFIKLYGFGIWSKPTQCTNWYKQKM